jgi:L-asparagine transporter-like permease
MNEIHWVLLGLIVMVITVAFFYLTDILPAKIENREVSIIISLGIGLLILVVDKRQDRHLNEIIEAQHEMTNEIHKMITEEIRLIKEMKRENNDRS